MRVAVKVLRLWPASRHGMVAEPCWALAPCACLW